MIPLRYEYLRAFVINNEIIGKALSIESLANSKHSIEASQVAQRKRLPESGSASRVGNGNPLLVFLAGKIPWTEEPGGL